MHMVEVQVKESKPKNVSDGSSKDLKMKTCLLNSRANFTKNLIIYFRL